MTIDRRTFVQTATVLAVAAAGTQAAQAQTSALSARDGGGGERCDPNALPDLSALDPNAPPAPRPDGVAAPSMKRFDEQRWILDNIIRANGIDWDQPRLPGLAAALGPEATTDIAAIRTRVQKFADITPAFELVARRRKRGRSKRRRSTTRLARATTSSWPPISGAERSGRSTRTTPRTSSSIRRSGSAISSMRSWRTIRSSRPGSRSTANPCRAGFTCLRYRTGQRVPCVVSIPAWTATRSAASRSPGTAFCRGGLRFSS